MRTQDTKGNVAWENIPKRATWLHANLGRHPLDIALWARREGEGFASLRRVIHHLVLWVSVAKNLSMAIDESASGTLKPLPAGSPAAWLWNALQHTCRFFLQARI